MTEYVTYSLPGVVDSFRDGITIEPYDALGSNFLPAIDLAFSNWESAIFVKFSKFPRPRRHAEIPVFHRVL